MYIADLCDRRAPEIGLWQLRDIDPLERWTSGRTILVGDAAHAMLPLQGQGASQTFEDAVRVKKLPHTAPTELHSSRRRHSKPHL